MEPMGLYWHEVLQQVRNRMPAGGHGGGVTGQADVEATPEQAAAFLKERAAAEEVKLAETQVLAETPKPEVEGEYKTYAGHDPLKLAPADEPHEVIGETSVETAKPEHTSE